MWVDVKRILLAAEAADISRALGKINIIITITKTAFVNDGDNVVFLNKSVSSA